MSNSDYFTQVASPTATTLSSPGHTIGGTTFNVGSTSGWPTATGVFFSVDVVTIVNGVQVQTPGSYTVWEGDITGGTTISNAVIRQGTDQNYPAGSTTRVYISVTAARENRLVTGLTNNLLNQDSTIKAGAVANAAALANNVVTTAKIADGQITSPKLNLTGNSGALVATAESTTSTTYADLTTTTDTVTITVGASGHALVSILCQAANGANGGYVYMSFLGSGANTITAGTYYASAQEPGGSASSNYTLSGTFLLTGLTPGSTTFKAKYQVATGGSGSGTGIFSNRRIAAIPL